MRPHATTKNDVGHRSVIGHERHTRTFVVVPNVKNPNVFESSGEQFPSLNSYRFICVETDFLYQILRTWFFETLTIDSYYKYCCLGRD